MKKTIKPEICYIRKDNHVLVFDRCGRHIPDLEGLWTEKEREIRETAPKITIVDWRRTASERKEK